MDFDYDIQFIQANKHMYMLLQVYLIDLSY